MESWIDLALRTDSPPHLIDKSTFDEKIEMKRCERLNRISMMIIEMDILETLRDANSEKIITVMEFF